MKNKVFNKRIFGFATAFIVMIILALTWFTVDEVGLGIICIVTALIQIAFILITPICYIFSEESLIIQYWFGLEENIQWQYIRVITSHLEDAGRFIYLDSYKFYYYPEEKHLFFMRGVVNKNRTTEQLMKKYCPKKH